MQYTVNYNIFESNLAVRVVRIAVDATDLADVGTKLATVDLTDETSVSANADITVEKWVEPNG